jgi:hypothetical protein
MSSAPVGFAADYCPNGDSENLGSRSSFWLLDLLIPPLVPAVRSGVRREVAR